MWTRNCKLKYSEKKTCVYINNPLCANLIEVLRVDDKDRSVSILLFMSQHSSHIKKIFAYNSRGVFFQVIMFSILNFSQGCMCDCISLICTISKSEVHFFRINTCSNASWKSETNLLGFYIYNEI